MDIIFYFSRDEEKNNPRVLPRYLPWWLTNSGEVDETLKVVELRGLADQIGIDHNGLKKADLLNLLRESVKLYSLTGTGVGNFHRTMTE